MLNGLESDTVVTAALKECRSLGAPRAEHHGADLSDPAQIVKLFEFMMEKWGRGPDILINNAGMNNVALYGHIIMTPFTSIPTIQFPFF